jgi:hypothetical protein
LFQLGGIPVRNNNAGADVDMKAIWQAIDSSLFASIGTAIEQKSGEKFGSA